jgi:hypothetical protein
VLVPFRKDAAALAVAAATVAGFLTLPAGAADPTVVLQVVPRGNGTITSSVADRTTGSTTCAKSQEPGECVWTFLKGASVVLTAKAASGSTFAGWSTAECPGTGDCRPSTDDDQSIVALFSKLTLSVATSGAKPGDLVTSSPAGISCPPTCDFAFDAKAKVTLTVKTGSGSTLTSFPYGCTSVDGATCTLTMYDDPQAVGVKLNGAEGPKQPDVVKVTVRIGKTGDGAGRVTATGLDCGNLCLASFPYGALARLTAAPEGGSVFGGWGGICDPDSDLRCTLPIGPITLVRPKFVKDAPPSAPGTPTASPTESSIALAWGASRDDVGVKSYEVFVGSESAPRVTTDATTATISGLNCGMTFAVSIQAVDTAGNRSSRTSAQVSTAVCPLGVQFVRSTVVRGKKPQVVIRLTTTVATKGSGTLLVNGKQVVRRGVVLHTGTNALTFRLPPGSGKRNVRLVLRLVDPKGGAKMLSFRLVVRT